jgi:hypothetical protein
MSASPIYGAVSWNWAREREAKAARDRSAPSGPNNGRIYSVRPKAFRKRVVCFSYKIATINSYKHARRALFYCRLKSHFGSIKIGSLGVRK